MPFLAYTCKFCQSKGTAEYAEDSLPLKLEVWRSWLCCNPCADFEAARRKLGRRIARSCSVLWSVRKCLEGAERLEQESKVRGKLTALTRDYSRLLAAHYRKPELWDDQFVAWLMEKPVESWKILSTFRANFVKMLI